MSSLVHVAFYHGQQASDHYDYVQAYEHFTKALNFYSATGYRDPQLWSKILFERAGILMRMSHVKEGTQDINRALTACPQPCGNYVSVRNCSKVDGFVCC